MDGIRFDAIAKAVVRAHSRRGTLRLLAGSVFTGLLGGSRARDDLLAKAGKKKRKKKKKGCSPLQTKCGNRCCPYDTFCCGGECWAQHTHPPAIPVQCCHDHLIPQEEVCCPSGNSCALDEACCGAACCPPGSTCCGDGSCCPQGSTCCGESCCPPGQICSDGECRAPCGGIVCPPGFPCCNNQCQAPCDNGQVMDPTTCLCQDCPSGQSLCGDECCDDPCGCDAGVCTNSWYECGSPGASTCCYQGYTCCTNPVPFCCSPLKPICSGTGGCAYS